MKRGEKVVQILTGAGTETASIQTVQSVISGKIRLKDSDCLFDSRTMRPVEPSIMPGFSKRLIVLE